MTFKVVSLFAGAGGLSRGFSDKFSIVLAVDSDKNAVETYRANFDNIPVLHSKVEGVNWHTELRKLGLCPEDVKLVIGGPPCQGFSKGNSQTRDTDHPLNHLWRNYLEVVEILQPEWFVMENVPGIRNINGHKDTVSEIVHVFKERIGYQVKEKTLLASEFGVPQNRRRVVFVGSRNGYIFKFPEPYYESGNFISVREAIVGDLPSLQDNDGKLIEGVYDLVGYVSQPRSQYQELIRNGNNGVTSHVTVRSSERVRNRWRDIPPGGNWENIKPENIQGWRNVSDEELRRVSHSNLYKRLDPDKPSITIANFRRSMICHPEEDRIISIREAARLQSFPDDHVFIGPKNSQQQMVANAVPPLLSEAIATQLYNIMKGDIDLEIDPVQLGFTITD